MIGGRHEGGGIGERKPAVAIRRPLHRRANAVAVAEVDVVAHSDFIAVIDDRRAWHRKEKAVHQLDAAAIAFKQRREASPDAEVDAGAAVSGISLPQDSRARCRSPFRASVRRDCAGKSPIGSSPESAASAA